MNAMILNLVTSLLIGQFGPAAPAKDLATSGHPMIQKGMTVSELELAIGQPASALDGQDLLGNSYSQFYFHGEMCAFEGFGCSVIIRDGKVESFSRVKADYITNI